MRSVVGVKDRQRQDGKIHDNGMFASMLFKIYIRVEVHAADGEGEAKTKRCEEQLHYEYAIHK